MKTMNVTSLGHLARFREQLFDDSLLWFATAGIFSIAISVGRMVYIGWQPFMLAHLVIGLWLWGLWLGRRWIPYLWRVLGMLFVWWVVPLTSFKQLGPTAVALTFLIMFAFTAILFLRLRLALWLIAGDALSLILLGVAASQRWVTFNVDFQSYAYHPLTWVNITYNILVLGGITAFITWRMLQGLVEQETALRIERDQAQRYLDTTQTIMVSLDREGRVAMINRKGCELLGYAEHEILGRNWFEDFLPQPMGTETVQPLYWQILTGELEGVSYYENPVLCRDGRQRLIAWHNAFMTDDDGHIVGSLSSGEDITERRQAEQELHLAKEAAEEANQAKSAFLASMSHELRTPLNVIIGFSQMLDMEVSAALAPSQKAPVGHILKSSRHLLSLINGVLDLARIEAGELEVEMRDLAIGPIIEEAVASTRALASDRDIVVTCDIAPDLFVRGDVVRLRQILLNLLSNAVKYNVDGGAVAVSCEMEGQGIRLVVSDTGPGIPEGMRTRLFQPFQRLGAEQTAIEGTGIGLAVSQRLAEAMGGEIGFDAGVREGGRAGSRFWIALQAAMPERAAEAHSPAPTSIGWRDDSPQGRVLYVEDKADNRALMRHAFLALPRVELLTAEDAETGLAMIRDNPPDLVLMDIDLPGMDGLAAMQALEADPETASIPVIAVSAAAMPQDIQAGLAVGFQAYLTKPLDLAEMIALVCDVLKDGATKEEIARQAPAQ